MSVEVASRELRNDTAGLLRRVEEGERIVITRRGKPVADLVPHQEETSRWLTPSEVMEIREIASADPTWAADLARLRAETTEDLGPIV
ncbi:MAG TPA: type II toxin-antitoxin system prevent-host-death family antitoxin [Solirubrobacterales bacterium]|nr:type II toxin-antitoxin system prevent-host-death family antitoxin [Solirubrobacterales bacterium]